MIVAIAILIALIIVNLLFGDVYTIRKGCHYHQFHLVRIPRFVKSKVIWGDFRLPPSCWFELRNQDDHDLNKLVGVTRGLFVHKNSVRLAWRPDIRKNYFQIHAYVYDKGNRISRYLTTVGSHEKITWEIAMGENHYHFKVAEESLTIKKTKSKRWGFSLSPYFGGNNKSPQTMNIYLKWINYKSCGLFYLLFALLLMGCSTTKQVNRTQKDTESTEVTTGKTYTETKVTENADTVIIIPGERVSGTAPARSLLSGDTIKVEGSGVVVSVSVKEDKVKIVGEKKPQKLPVKVEKVTEVKKSEDLVTEKKDTDQTVTVDKEVKRDYWQWVAFGVGFFVIIFGAIVMYLKLK